MVVGDGPQQVQQACESALAVLVAAMPSCAVSGSRAQWAAAVGATQRVVNVAAAVQDAAIARLAAIEPQWLEDGTEVESSRALGHLALDAPAIVSGVLNVAAVHAERRTTTAVRLAADGPTGTSTASGLGGLHAAMTAGVLDAYRAQVVAEELAYAPAQVAASVVTALAPHFGTEDGALLRRRCRRVLARISPDLLLQRAKRARSGCGLRRWVDEPGVDRWEGTFPSEDAARAWAAIDALAQRYVRDGVCPTIENARGKALTDLVTANATIEAVITLTVPATLTPNTTLTPSADTTGPGPDDQATEPTTEPAVDVRGGDLVEVTGLAGNQPVLVPRGWVAATITDQRATDPGKVSTAPCHRVTGALADPETHSGAHAGHEAPAPATTGPENEPTGRGQAPAAASSGAGGDRYRPSQRLVHRVKARDRRCRFPGCTVAAVFCDLDHVRPWPAGPTTMTNLVCLCRRHHRIKQRPGWSATLAPDGTLTWTDPTGTTRTTAPVDALHPTVLPDTTPDTGAGPTDPTPRTGTAPEPTGAAPAPATSATSGARVILADAPHSDLEFTHEHRTADLPWTTTTAWHDHHDPHHTELTPTTHLLLHDPPEHQRRTHRPRPEHTHRRPTDPEPPPF